MQQNSDNNGQAQQAEGNTEETKKDVSQIWRTWKADVVEKVRAAAKMKNKRVNELLESLVAIDKALCDDSEPLLVEADTFFTTIFKITYYDEPDFAIKNPSDQPEGPYLYQHDKLL